LTGFADLIELTDFTALNLREKKFLGEGKGPMTSISPWHPETGCITWSSPHHPSSESSHEEELFGDIFISMAAACEE